MPPQLAPRGQRRHAAQSEVIDPAANAVLAEMQRAGYRGDGGSVGYRQHRSGSPCLIILRPANHLDQFVADFRRERSKVMGLLVPVLA